MNEDLKTFLEAHVSRTKPGKEPKAIIGAGARWGYAYVSAWLQQPHGVTPLPPPPPSCAGVIEPKIGTAIQDGLGMPCASNETVTEVIRGVRLHFDHYIGALAGGNLEKAQLGLAHSYSRAKVKFNVNKSDNMIIQAIALLDQLVRGERGQRQCATHTHAVTPPRPAPPARTRT